MLIISYSESVDYPKMLIHCMYNMLDKEKANRPFILGIMNLCVCLMYSHY